ncbi:C-X-C motif chemokine 2-like [Liasis olivaceus]
MSRLAFLTTARIVLFLLLAGSALHPHARELRCKCVKVFSQRISLQSIASVDFTPEGPHCVRPEVIITRKDGKQVCMNPRMPWVKRIVQEIVNQQNDRL